MKTLDDAQVMMAATEPAVQASCYTVFLSAETEIICNTKALPKCYSLIHLPDCQWQASSPPRCSPRLMETWCAMPAPIPPEETAQAGRLSVTTATMTWSVS